MNIKREFDFDDVLILPADYCTVSSRDDVSLSQEFGHTRLKFNDNYRVGFDLDIPIIASPMKGIVGTDLIIELSKLGGIGILHRFLERCKFFHEMEVLYKSGEKFGVAISLKDEEERHKFALDSGASIICIDVANGHLNSVIRKSAEISDYIFRNNYNCLLMAGNVVTLGGVGNLDDAGVDLFRVGIGGGALCTTRNYTGIGRPQISAISECSTYSGVVADGGIRNSGDIVKALAAGADAVMIGSLFARALESENKGIIFGMASKKIQEEYFHSVKSVEGMEKELTPDISLEELINELIWRVKSGLTYVGARNLTELRQNARFVEVGKGSIKEL